MTLSTAGLAVNGTFVSASDRNAKEDFQPVPGRNPIQTHQTGHVICTKLNGRHLTLIGDVSEDALRSIVAAIK